MQTMSKSKNFIFNTIHVLTLPVLMFMIMEILVFLKTGGHLITTVLDLRNLFRDLGISTIIAFALSLNLASGRFDLSLGAQRLIATIIGGNIAISLGFNGVGVLVTVILCGLFAGFLVGMTFVVFRVPPVVLGLGMAMIYESIAFALSEGKGLQLFGVKNIGNLIDPTFTMIVLALATLFVFVLFTYTKFRYEMQAMRSSQKIAIDSGINVFRHVVICYALAGGLVGISGIFSAAFTGSLAPQLGMTSNSAVIAMTFPMFIGIYLSRRSNVAIGILLGTLTLKFFSIGLVALKLSNSLNSTITMFLFIGFLAFLANEDIVKKYRMQKARIAEAQEKKKKMKQKFA